MLKCWDSDPDDRPTFTKIGSNISKVLQIMSGYLDMSAADTSKVLPTLDEIAQQELVKRSLWYFEYLVLIVHSVVLKMTGLIDHFNFWT